MSRLGTRTRRFGAAVAGVVLAVASAAAQEPSPAQEQPPAHQHEPAAPSPAGQHDDHTAHQQPQHAGHDSHTMTEMARDASGTSWLPDASPMYVVMRERGAWQLMFHENAFVQALHDSGDRGESQFGSINWFMGMAHRPLGRGRLTLRGMVSLEPWTIPGCGYPDLLASGERCDGEHIHDRQHPHDLLMEVAARFDAPLAGGARWMVYGGPAAEPALGPVAFPHRVSAMPNPIAPIAHHWLDSTHVSFGVVTGGVYGAQWRVEASAFNGREPDEDRTDIDLAALDSVSARVWFLPTPRWALQASAGRLEEAEAPEEDGEAAHDVGRITASATYHRPLGDNGTWASTIAWGRNEEDGAATHALLLETNLTTGDRHTWYGRFEIVGKRPEELAVPSVAERFDVAKLQWGYTRYLQPRAGFAPGIGGSLSLGLVPSDLEAAYGRRANPGVALYVTLRPALHAAAP